MSGFLKMLGKEREWAARLAAATKKGPLARLHFMVIGPGKPPKQEKLRSGRLVLRTDDYKPQTSNLGGSPRKLARKTAQASRRANRGKKRR